ncbi:hydrogenase/sulfur reductase, beta subunit [Chloroherpeton thalassium ATCC 35110]|uniref:Hydrogenase/sulfur reductase, beta subunit n=1 Tax=Chloroherpeton thalassium (strain ATCC 35110 / GB-78) TaxID=517418 RepID=B3QU20_CHLT3|nr:4Fe-4S dicluster domain-containing protein [Chloroherpeton thalassium]ACF12818.1 hydrogenase/sulfur reductase, beta subunit [Chloroherpeton thalassium ATCC 35110]
MIYKVISKPEFRKFVEALIEANDVLGPVKADMDAHGKPLYKFERVASFDEMDLDYTISYSSVKNFFLPYREKLSEYDFSENDWHQDIEYRVNPRVLLGLRPCDINALNILDKIFYKGTYPSPYYIARRKNTFILGLDHDPLPDCFCSSLGCHTVGTGFDMFGSDLGDRYYMAVNSAIAFNFLKNFNVKDPTNTDDKAYIERRKFLKKSFQTNVEVSGLPSFLDIEFQSPIWKKWGDKCLNCGTCAMVCPTCYCYQVEENIAVNLRTASKDQMLYSCTILDFAEVAGGHNFRPNKEDRLKYRYYHHYRGFAENASEPICVGCNRCGRACLAGINPKDVINDLRLENEDRVSNT